MYRTHARAEISGCTTPGAWLPPADGKVWRDIWILTDCVLITCAEISGDQSKSRGPGIPVQRAKDPDSPDTYVQGPSARSNPNTRLGLVSSRMECGTRLLCDGHLADRCRRRASEATILRVWTRMDGRRAVGVRGGKMGHHEESRLGICHR
ncbi:hypothetical protein BD310DRAFT_1022805 [Dichomitus squalens]|uniref:Uncharacterized protein n=1 Tax=Dichomitus squalens TaxID=114155 RepID=A0A4Q9PQW5_9APHY|nr:hypothetical protein BD310DRAFT_1022805 [Dichomitus squalens]